MPRRDSSLFNLYADAFHPRIRQHLFAHKSLIQVTRRLNPSIQHFIQLQQHTLGLLHEFIQEHITRYLIPRASIRMFTPNTLNSNILRCNTTRQNLRAIWHLEFQVTKLRIQPQLKHRKDYTPIPIINDWRSILVDNRGQLAEIITCPHLLREFLDLPLLTSINKRMPDDGLVFTP